MAAAQLVLGIVLLAAGAGAILGRRKLAARGSHRGALQASSPMLWVVMGVLLLMNGVLQVLLVVV